MSTGKGSISTEVWNKLRDCQRNSIAACFRYMDGDFDGKSCLINLPTGSGKSGVITLVAQKSDKKRILVLCNRIAVIKQLRKKLEGEFYDDINFHREEIDKIVHKEIEFPLKDGIYCLTFQKLQVLTDSHLSQLAGSVDLVIVDEGHVEPSHKWSERVRSLKCHKIIVTATPYRNDLFQFDISSKNGFIYTFAEAVDAKVLAAPVFETISKPSIVEKISIFLKSNNEAKCVVKCKSFEDVEEYFGLLSVYFKVLAIHENYNGDKRHNCKTSVPDRIGDLDFNVIIHQRKLDEGIDIPQAKLLVLTYAVASGRELVQTIGRIVRMYKEVAPLVYELDSASQANSSLWANYLEFDKSLKGESSQNKFIKSLDTNQLLRNYLDAFPDVAYVGNLFKKKFSFDQIDLSRSINIPLASVCFIYKNNGFIFQDFIDKIYWDAESNGELAIIKNNVNGFDAILSVTFNSSKFLKDSLFFEPSLELVLAMDLGEYIALYDSRSRDFSFNNDLKLGASIEVDKLLNLANRSEKCITREAFTSAIGTTDNRPESLHLKGSELEKVNISQANSQYALSMLKVINCKKIGADYIKESSYYLGMTTGRVSDQKKRNFSLAELRLWIKDIDAALMKQVSIDSELIQSFAQPVKGEPSHPPASFMLDFTEIESSIIISNSKVQEKIDSEYLFVDGHQLKKFPWSNIKLEYDKNEKKLSFSIASSGLNIIDENGVTIKEKDFIAWLNRIPLKALFPNGLSYSNNKFYRSLLPTEKGINVEQSRHFQSMISINELNQKGLTEKDERNTSQDSFGENSIFQLVDQLKDKGGPFFNNIQDVDIVFCSDLGTEPCDFILSSPSKLVFVHVKCGKSTAAIPNPKSAAGNIAEVGGQAIKNIEHLISHSIDTYFGNKTELSKPWKITPNPSLNERLRLFNNARFDNPTGDTAARGVALDELFKEIAKRRQDYAVKKEIWLVIGNGFSKNHFKQQLSKGQNGAPESLQSYQFIDSWLATLSSFDIDFKMFCSR
jgi:superfamily II DNA or RNA helicase